MEWFLNLHATFDIGLLFGSYDITLVPNIDIYQYDGHKKYSRGAMLSDVQIVYLIIGGYNGV